MATLNNGKIVPIPEQDLPVLLPENKKDFNSSNNPSNNQSSYYNTYVNHQNAIREKDTFDTFMESSWYYARYTCPHFKKRND